MPVNYCFYYTMAPGTIIKGGPGVKAQMSSMEQKGQYAKFIEIFGKQVSLETANKAEVAGIFKAFSFGASTEVNFSEATQKYKEHHQEHWSNVLTSESYQFDVPQGKVCFSYVKMVLVKVRLASGVKSFAWPVGEVVKGPADKGDLLHLLDGKIRLDESFAAVLDCFHIKPDHLCTRQAMEATLQPCSIRPTCDQHIIDVYNQSESRWATENPNYQKTHKLLFHVAPFLGLAVDEQGRYGIIDIGIGMDKGGPT